MFKHISLAIFSLLFLMACANTPVPINNTNTNDANSMTNLPTSTEQAIIKTNKGDITVKLYDSLAPKTVANFIKLSTEPQTGRASFYAGIKFHRVIADFMIQTGDPLTVGEQGKDFVYDDSPNPKNLPVAGTGGPGYTFADEFNSSLKFVQPGVVAMANAGPNTNGSQFFITHNSTEWLNNKHTIFGQVTSGQEIVDQIQRGDYIIGIVISDL